MPNPPGSTPEDSSKPVLLVLCTGNSCRSQMAEAFLRRHHGDRFEVGSGGTDPASHVHPLAIEVMAEIGLDLRDAKPKHSGEFLKGTSVSHLMLVCDRASQTCPRVWPGVLTRHDLPFDDPAHAEGTREQKLAVFRRVRDEIDAATRAWSPEQEGGRI